jgi:hypothetical protein
MIKKINIVGVLAEKINEIIDYVNANVVPAGESGFLKNNVNERKRDFGYKDEPEPTWFDKEVDVGIKMKEALYDDTLHQTVPPNADKGVGIDNSPLAKRMLAEHQDNELRKGIVGFYKILVLREIDSKIASAGIMNSSEFFKGLLEGLNCARAIVEGLK